MTLRTAHDVGAAESMLLCTAGLTDYDAAWEWQQQAAAELREGGPELLLLVQHPPVYTFGRVVRREHLLVPEDELRRRGAAIVETNRGGDVTFHGPGQLVGYPILDLRRRGLGPSEYVRRLESTLIATLERFGVEGERRPGLPGVWTSAGKIAAIGVRIERGVSLHGFALNVDVDLSWFDAIVPCGIEGAGVSSMARHMAGAPPSMEALTPVLVEAFEATFAVRVERAPGGRLSGCGRPR